jgi:hypothetical protein
MAMAAEDWVRLYVVDEETTAANHARVCSEVPMSAPSYASAAMTDARIAWASVN